VSTFELEHDNELIAIGCSVRNQQIGRGGEYYLISKNQIDQSSDRFVDLSKDIDYSILSYSAIKEQRKNEEKGLLLIYALDERGAPGIDNNVPIIGYSIHFPRIEDEIKVAYTTTINKDFDEEVMSDDDNSESAENL
jgi:hypothetical protein